MRWKKRYWSRLLLFVEIILFAGIYWFGAEGFRNMYKFQKENDLLVEEVRLLNKEIDKLVAEIDAFQQDPFYREKQAREQLQMARKNEEVYLVINKKETHESNK